MKLHVMKSNLMNEVCILKACTQWKVSACECTTQYTTNKRSYPPHSSLITNVSHPKHAKEAPCSVAPVPYGNVYMCKDGYPATVVWPLFVARNLFLDQCGFVSGSGSLPVSVLLFEEHANPGFSVCANKI